MSGEPGAPRCSLGPSNPPRQAERPQRLQAARPTAPTVPDAARRQGAASATTGRSRRRLPGLSEAPVPASAAACDPEAGRALQDTERGAAVHDPPLRLPRSPQGQYARPRRAPASSQSTEVESQMQDGSDSRMMLDSSEKDTHRHGKMAERGREGRAHGVMGSGQAIARFSKYRQVKKKKKAAEGKEAGKGAEPLQR